MSSNSGGITWREADGREASGREEEVEEDEGSTGEGLASRDSMTAGAWSR